MRGSNRKAKTMTKKYPTHSIIQITPSDDATVKDTFDYIGVGFTNKDGSLNLVFDEGQFPHPAKRLMIRARKSRAEKGGAA